MAKNKRIRSKSCQNCAQDRQTMYRVNTQKLNQWVIVCLSCQSQLEKELGYRYGGTWKAVKRH